MNTSYRDILSRINDPVLWWDEHAVPRFEPFQPMLAANIYASEAALVRITCQGCGKPFDVCFTRHGMDAWWVPDHQGKAVFKQAPMLHDQISEAALNYGDPPNDHPCAGVTMSSEARRVLEYWRRDNGEWRRDPVFEVDVEPDWVRPL